MSGSPIVTDVQAKALEALALFRFLTVDQMVRWGVGGDATHIRKMLRVLMGWGWVDATALTGLPGEGRLPRLYFLKPRGATEFGHLFRTNPPSGVKSKPTLRNELPHRLAILDTHLTLREWAASAGARVNWFDAEYDPSQSRSEGATAVPYDEETGRYDPDSGKFYTPDAVTRITLADNLPRLLVVEVYRGGRRGTLEHFRRKLPELRKVAEWQAVEAHHDYDHGARFLILFMDEDMRDDALDTWPDPDAEVWDLFFVKALPDLMPDFVAGWRQLRHPSPQPLFQLQADKRGA